MGVKLGVFGFLQTTHTQKTNAKQMSPKSNSKLIFRSSSAVRRFNAGLSSRSDRSRCRWHTHLPNRGFLITGKTRIPPIWAPCRDHNGAGYAWDLPCICSWQWCQRVFYLTLYQNLSVNLIPQSVYARKGKIFTDTHEKRPRNRIDVTANWRLHIL